MNQKDIHDFTGNCENIVRLVKVTTMSIVTGNGDHETLQ
jgi:hypothetical protein